MKKCYFLSVILGLSLVLNAQKVEKLKLTANQNPLNFAQKGKVNSSKSILKIFNYDNNEISMGIGISSAPYSLGTFIELPSTTLQPNIGKTIDYIRFGMDNSTIISVAKIVIYEDKLEGIPAFTQTLEPGSIINGWNQIKLDNGYKLVEGKTIFVGVTIETNAGGYTLTYDTDPTNYPQFSGHTILNGNYYGTLSNEIGIDADYNIQALITDGLGVDYTNLAIVGIKPSSEGCAYSSTELLKVTFLNKGEDSISTQFNLTATINGLEVIQQVSPTVFYPNVEKIVNLPAIDMSNYGVYNIHCSMDFADATPENNEFSTTLLSGDAVLRIELLTDAAPEQTSWRLIDQFGMLVIKSDALEAKTEYITELCVIDSNCYTWVISDRYGDGMAGNVNPGAFSLYYKDSIIALSPENGDFGSEFKVLGIGSGCSANDIQITHIDLPAYEAPQTLPIKGSLYNNGTDTLKSFDLVYKIDDFVSPVTSITEIAIPIGYTFDFVHEVPFDFFTDKTYLVELAISNPNGIEDENAIDNVLNHKIIINSNVIPKRQLIEHFTSSTNDECFNFTPLLDEMLASNYDNYSLIRYQTNWPEPGDPYYIDQTGKRVNYYNVNSLPTLYRNGNYNMDITQHAFDAYANEKTVLEIAATATYLNNEVSLSAKIKTVNTLEAGLTAYIAIVENNTNGNMGTNGETDFYNVLMQMLPNAEGTAMSVMETGDSKEIEFTFDMTNTFVEEMFDLSAVVFVQDDATKQVLQSTIIPIAVLDNIDENTTILNTIYPNPFSNSITLDNLQAGSKLLITNIMGQTIISTNTVFGKQEINTENFKPGIYIVTITDAFNNVVVRKIVKQ